MTVMSPLCPMLRDVWMSAQTTLLRTHPLGSVLYGEVLRADYETRTLKRQRSGAGWASLSGDRFQYRTEIPTLAQKKN